MKIKTGFFIPTTTTTKKELKLEEFENRRLKIKENIDKFNKQRLKQQEIWKTTFGWEKKEEI